MIELIIQTVWFFLPAGIANMSPVLFRWVGFLNYPIDLNKKFRGKPLFGKNKTYRGFLFGVLAAILTVYVQKILYPFMGNFSLVNYSNINIYLLGFLFGLGALGGDLVKSFFKRQIGMAPGKSWFPFDQIDWIIGSIIFVSFYIFITWKIIFISIFLFGLLHMIINLIGYYMRIKKNKF